MENKEILGDKELIELVVHRFGVEMGSKIKAKQLRREINEHPVTTEIKQLKQGIRVYERELLYNDYGKDIRKNMRKQKYDLEEQVYQKKIQRDKDTHETKNERKQLSDVVSWIDETKLLPELEKRNMQPEYSVSDEELVEMHKFKQEQVQAQKNKRK